jgi:hypothetical protein
MASELDFVQNNGRLIFDLRELSKPAEAFQTSGQKHDIGKVLKLKKPLP